MGSFNVSCVLSKLSINAGDRCGIIPLIPNKYRNDYTREGSRVWGQRSQSLYVAFGPPIWGVYDEYGELENIEASPYWEAFEETMGISALAILSNIWDNRIRTSHFPCFGAFVLREVYETHPPMSTTLEYARIMHFISSQRNTLHDFQEQHQRSHNWAAVCGRESAEDEDYHETISYDLELLLTGLHWDSNPWNMVLAAITGIENESVIHELASFTHFLNVCTSTNTLLQPTYKGPQYGDNLATNSVSEAIQAIIQQRKENDNE